MPNLTIEKVDNGAVIIANAVHEDILLAFPGADTYVEGTILARKQVADAIVATADVGNTGDGTFTAASVIAGDTIPLVGDYNLEVVTAVTNGGVFKLEDPNGNIVANNLVMTAGAGVATIFTVAGMTFVITDGATDFIVGDKAALTVAADGDVVIFAEDGLGGAQVPSLVLTYEITTAGAADVAARALVSGRVRHDKLVIDAGGTVTDRIADMLRDYKITVENSTDLSLLDNQ